MQEISESFAIPRSADRVWAAFQDVPQVATCMPGLEYLGEVSDDAQSGDTHAGRVKMKLGPISANFEGKATFTRIDPENRTATLSATGVDKKGGSQARAEITYQIDEIGKQESQVTLSGTIRLSGALANLGRSSIVKDVAHHLTGQFADSLQAMLTENGVGEEPDPAGDTIPPTPADTRPAVQAISGLALLKVVLQGWLRRLGLVQS